MFDGRFMLRSYDFTPGRWLTPDPLGGDIMNPQSLNRYAYALNNPTTLTDPLGLSSVSGCGAGIICVNTWEYGGTLQPPVIPPAQELGGSSSIPFINPGVESFGTAICSDGSGAGDCGPMRGPSFGTWNGFSLPAHPTNIIPGPQSQQQKHAARDQCVNSFGAVKKVADTIGVWGLGSAAFTAGSSAFTGGMQWVYGTTANNIAQTIAEQAPSPTMEGVLATVGEKASFWEGTLGTFGKASLAVTVGATGVSAGIRGYCTEKTGDWNPF